MWKKLLLIWMAFWLCTGVCSAKDTDIEELDVSSEHIIVYNLDEDKIIYENQAQEEVLIASVTKVMSAITVLDNVKDINEEIVITGDVFTGTDGYSVMGLSVGDRISIKELLYGLLLPSGADAANALAIHTAGSVSAFSDLMNAKVKELGLKHTHFDNPVGADSTENYSSAYDVAQILKYGLQNQTFKEIYCTREYEIPELNIELESTLLNYRDSYGFDISHIEGSKTGFTYGAGICLSSIAEYNDIHYLMVVLGSDVNRRYSAVQDSLTLYEYFDENYGIHQVIEKDQVLYTLKLKHGFEKEYQIIAKSNESFYLKNNYKPEDIQIRFEGVEELNYKIKKDDKLGKIQIVHQDEVLKEFEVYQESSLYYYDPIFIGILIGLLVLGILYLVLKIRYRRRRKTGKRRRRRYVLRCFAKKKKRTVKKVNIRK